MKGITHIFFDLDHTLWDYDSNARKVLMELYQHFQLDQSLSLTCDAFTDLFFHSNSQLWKAYHAGEIDKHGIRNQRFVAVLQECQVSDSRLCEQMNEFFLYHCPQQGRMIQDADIILGYLSKKYALSVITNGFEDVQHIKLKASKIDHYFDHVVTSDGSGYRKPSPEIFQHALKLSGARPHQCVMIGDSPLADVQGAMNAGLLPIYFNQKQKYKAICDYEVSSLMELIHIL